MSFVPLDLLYKECSILNPLDLSKTNMLAVIPNFDSNATGQFELEQLLIVIEPVLALSSLKYIVHSLVHPHRYLLDTFLYMSQSNSSVTLTPFNLILF